jgi:RNA polymerase sigma-70 factor, ECF subfamily
LHPSNTDIWQKIQEGDEKSFEILYHKYYSSLCFYANQFVQNTEIVKELVQDTFLKIWQNRSQLTIRGSVQSYLYQTIHNQSINELKHLSRNKCKVHHLVDESYWKFIEDTYAIDEFLIEKLEAHETEGLINEVIARLPAQCRDIFILSRFAKKTSKEIAELLGLSENSVRTQIYRALAKIKDALEKKN